MPTAKAPLPSIMAPSLDVHCPCQGIDLVRSLTPDASRRASFESSPPSPTLAVLNCGASGVAYAAGALELGHAVMLSAPLAHRGQLGKIVSDGFLTVVSHRGDEATTTRAWTLGHGGFSASLDFAHAIASCDVLYIAMTATGDAHHNSQEDMIRAIMDTGEDTRGKTFIVVNGLEFSWKADKLGLPYHAIVSTCNSQFAARFVNGTLVSKGKKQWMLASVHPYQRADATLREKLSAHLDIEYSFCERAYALFSPPNPCWHLPIAFANMSRIDAREAFVFYRDGLTPSVAKMIAAFDADRRAILHKLGYEDAPTTLELLNRMYGFAFEDYVSFALGTPAHNKTAGNPPNMTTYRYVTEDGRQARRWAVVGRAVGARVDSIAVYATQTEQMVGPENVETEESILRDFGLWGLSAKEAVKKLRSA